MKRWGLRISVFLSALMVLATGAWWGWREWWSAEHFREVVTEGIARGDFSRAERLKRWGADTEKWMERDSSEQVFTAIRKGDIESLDGLLDLGARTDCRNDRGPTPLFAAIWGPTPKNNLNMGSRFRGPMPDMAMVRRLIYAGADVNALDNSGWAALDLAIAWNLPEAVLALEEAGGTQHRPPQRTTVILDFTDPVPLPVVMRHLGGQVGVSIDMSERAANLKSSVRLHEPIEWQAALTYIAQKYDLKIDYSRLDKDGLVKVGLARMITLRYDKAPLRDVLATMAQMGETKIIVRRNVTGTVIMNVKNTRWEEVLKVLLDMNGLRMTRKDARTIFVHQ